jgi:hypothetical protein
MSAERIGFRSGDSAYVVDATWFPVLFTTFYGANNEPVVRHWFDWYHAQCRRADAENIQYVSITDATPSERPPATVRKLIADLTDAGEERWTELCLGAYIVLDSAIVRGALTAVQWLSPRTRRLSPVATLEDAIAESSAAMQRANMVLPPGFGPACYGSPERPAQQGETRYR